MYVISKVKSWIKKAGKVWLSYDPGNELISDRYVVLRVTPEMKPALLEVFGHLNGGTINRGDYQESFPKMGEFKEIPSNHTVLKDSQLRYGAGKDEIRVLHVAASGVKVTVRQHFAELFDDFSEMRLLTVFRLSLNGESRPSLVHVSDADLNFIGLIMPVIPSEIDSVINSFEFTARGDTDEQRRASAV